MVSRIESKAATCGQHPHSGGFAKLGPVLPHEENWRTVRAMGADSNLTVPPGRPAPLVYLPTVQQAGGVAIRAGPVLCLPPVWRAGLPHAEKKFGRQGIYRGQ